MKSLGTLILFLSFVFPLYSQKTSETVNVHNENYINIPGTAFYIIPPESFKLSPRFPGLEDDNTHSYIVFSHTKNSITESILSEKSMNGASKLIKEEKIRFNNCDATFSNIEKNENGNKSFQWILLFGNNNETIKVIGFYNGDSDKATSEKIKKSILTTIHKSE